MLYFATAVSIEKRKYLEEGQNREERFMDKQKLIKGISLQISAALTIFVGHLVQWLIGINTVTSLIGLVALIVWVVGFVYVSASGVHAHYGVYGIRKSDTDNSHS